MEYTSLPEMGMKVSRVALGGCPLGGHGWGKVEDADSITAVRTAVDEGVNFFDTADVYGFGHSEEILSKSLGDSRHDVCIATKFGVRQTSGGETIKDTSPSWIRTAVEASLKRLRIDVIPLYYMHWPDGVTPIEDVMQELDKLRKNGKISAIGLSNISAEELERATAVAPVSAVQVQYSLVDRKCADALAVSVKKHRVPLVTWGSLAQGLLTGKYNRETIFPPNDRRHRYENFQGEKFTQNLKVVEAILQVTKKQQCTPSQVAIRWLLEQDNVGTVLFGAKNSQQVRENISAMNLHLVQDDLDILGRMNAEETS